MATNDEIATADEIDRRVEEVDTARSAKRSAAAKQVGELAQRRTALAKQLDEIERQLGEVLADTSDVMDIDELERFTGVPAVDLTRWLTAQKPVRTRRKKPAAGAQSNTSRGLSTARTPTIGQASTPPEPAVPRTGAANAPERVAAGVT